VNPEFTDQLILGRVIFIDPGIIIAFEDETIAITLDDPVNHRPDRRVAIRDHIADRVVVLYA
jgi:hypothetical protein